MDITALQAARGYTQAARNTTGADSGSGNALTTGAQDFADVLRASETTATEAMTSRADPHALVEALANTQLAVETAVTVRDRVVEAYQEILRMPV